MTTGVWVCKFLTRGKFYSKANDLNIVWELWILTKSIVKLTINRFIDLILGILRTVLFEVWVFLSVPTQKEITWHLHRVANWPSSVSTDCCCFVLEIRLFAERTWHLFSWSLGMQVSNLGCSNFSLHLFILNSSVL